MALKVTPITAKLHYDDVRQRWRLVGNRLDVKGAGDFDVNKLEELIENALTLVEIITILLEFFAAISPTDGPAIMPDYVGDLNGLGVWVAQHAGGTYTPATP